MSDQILEVLKKDMNGMTLDEIRQQVPGAGLAHMRQLVSDGLVRFDPNPNGGGLYKPLPAAFK